MRKEVDNALRGQGIKPSEFIRRAAYTQFQTWLGETGGVEGCPIDCKYCFLQLDGKTPLKPRVFTDPQQIVGGIEKSLLASNPNMPIHFGSQTDIFATRDNIEYYTRALEIYGHSDYPNPLVFITKKSIPDNFIEKVAEAVGMGKKIVFYISYSGLGGTQLEPNVINKQLIRNFKLLKAHNVPVVHYWRPFLPQNSTPNVIYNILYDVTENATCSVLNGLRLNNGIVDNLVEFWPELETVRNVDFSGAGEFWPKGVRQNTISLIRERFPDYPVFFGNTPCSLAFSQNLTTTNGLYNSNMCIESQCPQKRRTICKTSFTRPYEEDVVKVASLLGINQNSISASEKSIVINGKIETGKLTYLSNFFNFPVTCQDISYEGGYNWANVTNENKIIEVPWKQP